MDAKQLKDSILQFAMQGKLVPQDPNDEPSIELLKRIKEKKEKLIAQKIIKKEKVFPDISKEEIPFDIPDTWEWVRLGDIAIYIQRGKSPKYSDIEKVPVISQKCIQWKGFNLAAARFVDPDTMDKYDSVRFVRDGDLLWNSTGLGTVGRINRYSSDGIDYETVVVDGHVTIVRLMDSIDSEFILRYLASPTIQHSIEDICSGSTKQKELNTSTIKNIVVPVPPLREQKRLVEKIKELSLKWERYENLHESIVTLDDELPSKLEKSILQYAMEGKLVEQNSTDESVSKLIERIKLEKEELIKNKIIKKEKALLKITEEEIPFDIPESWEWVRLGEISTILNGYAFKSGTYVEKSKNQLIRLGNVKNSGLLLEAKPAYISDEIAANAKDFLLKRNDILVTMTGTKGKRDYFYTCKVSEEDTVLKNLYLNQRVGCIRAESILSDFLNYALKAEIVKDTIFKHETGTANQGNIGIGAIRNLLIPLPPIEEQVRINRKIEAIRKQLASLK
ncbi:restriction endonuclease subunit S [Bacillus toyonensis]|uniref:restriction endonuclease subunit S n=1 Tax=Bacillus toyonensis TaxID=155322 RepID=UPI000BF2213D|nr:restriction endonuclease subunit S [Bacillus toyonensis]PEM90478.1 hypothetical protein CN629_20470 [Bacillus toyonensis]